MIGIEQMDRVMPSKKIVIRRGKNAPTDTQRSLKLVADRAAASGELTDTRAQRRSSDKVLTSSAQLPLAEKVLSFSDSREEGVKTYVLGELVADKAVVFKANNGVVWLLSHDNLSQEELLDLASTKSEIRKHEKNFRIAKCPEPLFVEFWDHLKEQHKKKQAFSTSDQHIHFEALVLDAVEKGVSDIHITLARGVVSVEYRIDSMLQKIDRFSWSVSVEQTTSLVRSVFNTIAEGTKKSWNSRVPQDASIVRAIKGKNYQLRYAHDNVEGDGFHCVLRVLDDLGDKEEGEESQFVALQKLGLYDDEVAVVDRMLEAPFGFLCVSGTTGSGKSTFLKNLISGYGHNNPGKNIVTVENPVEYRIYNAKQTSVSSPEAMGEHLISILRRDPDAILIGEIRDRQSAKTTIEATQTGHYVWSTLHASNALAQVSRLEDIGISRLTISAPEFMTGMVHLSLARKVCKSCRIPIKTALQQGLIQRDRFDRVKTAVNGAIENVFVANPSGCAQCSTINATGERDINAGFKGRMTVPEMVIPTLKILKAIKEGDDLGAYEAWRESGGLLCGKGRSRAVPIP